MELPNPTVLLVRGATRRCPWCGDRKAYFVGWFTRQPTCRNCGQGFRRGDDAFELGAITANIIVTFSVILITIGVGIAVTAPDIPVFTVTALAMALGLVCPVLMYPVSFTLWQAVDLTMRRPNSTSDDQTA